jgi:cysteine-rich repeat protein
MLKRVLVLTSLCLAAAGCFSPASVECSTGLVCPPGTQCTEDGDECISITATCGNGKSDPGEKCDDGNVKNYDGCRADCRGEGRCGDGFADIDLILPDGGPLEVCDNGGGSGDGCSADCRSLEICGNQIVDVGEDCDDGRIGTEDCNTSCKLKRCGDGTLDTRSDGGNEACDDGNTVSGDLCSGDCRSREVCGNAITDVQEECDDGRVGTGDCAITCRFKRCGDGTQDTRADGGREACDDGDPDGGALANGGPRCSPLCVLKQCGNGVRDFFASAPDGGVRDEECDDGNLDAGDLCGPTCKVERCGNFELDPGEVCDDGNLISGDGCSSDCLGVEACGDGRTDVVLRDGGREICDDGNTSSGDGCRADCQGREVCGDAKLDPVLLDGGTERCDDGNIASGDNCRSDCRGLEACGDGLVDPVKADGGNEACDDGNRDGGDGCRFDCRGLHRWQPCSSSPSP